jgi:hypothetical protein
MHVAAFFFEHWLWHPLKGLGYQFWSGIGSDLGEITLLGIAIGAYKHINCEEPGCWRPGHRHPDHGRPVCRHHFHSDSIPVGMPKELRTDAPPSRTS